MFKKILRITTIGIFIMVLTTVFALSPAMAKKSEPPKIIELSFAHTVPAVSPLAKVCQKWANRAEEQSGDRVKINNYWSQSLLKASELFRGVQSLRWKWGRL